MTQEFVTLPREVVEQALAAMSLALSDVDWRKDSPTQPVIHKAYNATRAALDQPQPKRDPLENEQIIRMWHDAKGVTTSRTLPFEWYRLGIRHSEHRHNIK